MVNFKKVALCVLILILAASGLSSASEYGRDLFTAEERDWIERHKNKEIVIGVAQDYIPIEYINRDGVPKGLGISLIDKVSRATGLQFKMYEDSSDMTWNEILESFEAGKVDLLTSVSFSEDRTDYINFSNPYTEMTQAVIGHADNRDIVNRFSDIDSGTVAIPNGYWFRDMVARENPGLNILTVKNMDEALKSISSGRADYTVCEIPVFTYYKERTWHKNIKIVGELKEKNEIFIGVQDEYSELIPIINRVISVTEQDEIYESAFVVSQNFNKEHVLAIIASVLFLLLVFAVLRLYKIFSQLAFAKKEAEDANLEKSNTMLRVSHDLRSPITVIMGYAQAINDGIVSGEEETRKYITRIYERAKYLSEMTDDFFMISKLESGALTLELSEVNLSDYLEYIAEGLRIRASSKNISINTDFKDSELSVNIDKVKFGRVIENLIMNGINYGVHGGKIDVSVSKAGENKLKICISDDGIGIDSEDIPNIFDLYYSGKNKCSDSSGIGLYIVKKIVSKHGGEVWVESSRGKGSSFTILI